MDGEINREDQLHIREHLAQCPECRRLEEELRTHRALFENAKQREVPDRVWQNIRDGIIAERLNQEGSVSRGILERLKESILSPRPVFAFTSVFAVILCVAIFTGVLIQKRQAVSNKNGGEGIAGYSINGESQDTLYDLGTNIEEYFL